ncbi:centromere protein J-like [Hypanus sabinus]|uniref:centromere protein J-like n=1 Tax=Hypanus sabinus TaxID=79690 RepID=UPI0028C4FF5D|nr:centromere protein J-like [Hypanus sabinus]XP_059820227.1 centromere protein J-like [Hypanus sabinus]
MEISEMSTIVNNPGQNFLAEWTTNVTRAGVILNPPFCFSDVYSSLQECRSTNDSFSTEFAPLQYSNNSSCFSLDSLLEADTQKGSEQPGFDKNGSSDLHSDSSQNGLLSCNNVAGKQATEKIVYNIALVQRLEQLKEWQQERQEQLKKQHLEQLQQLVNEQQTLLGLIGTQGYAETLSSLDDVGKKNPVKVVLQQDGHVAQENPVLEGETGVHIEDSAASPCSTEPVNEHQNNKDSTRTTSVQSPPEKSYSYDAPSFTTLEERPIKPGVTGEKETFEEFLEKQMKMEEQRLQQQLEQKQLSLPPVFAEDKGNQKRKFLKCGEGLARFSKIKSSNLVRLKADKERNLINQDSVSLKKANCQQMQRKLTLLSKENHNTSSSWLVNKPKTIGKGKSNSALCLKKVAALGTCSEDAVFQSLHQTEEITEASEGHVHNAHKTETINVVQDYGQTKKQIKQGSELLHELASPCKAERLQKKSGNILPTCPIDGASNEIENSFEISFQKKMENWNKEDEKEIVELNEFEFLEQAAEELSFSSNSSFVLKMAHQDWQYNKDPRLSSTPIKFAQHNQMFENSNDPKNNRNVDDSDKKNIYLKSNYVEAEEKFTSVFDPLISNEAVAQSVKCDSQEDQCSVCDTTSDSKEDLDSTLTNESEKQSVICNSNKEDNPNSVCGKQPADSLNKDKKMDIDLDLSSDDDDVKMLTVIENDKLDLSQKEDSSLFNSEGNLPLQQEKVEFDDDQTWTDQEEGGFNKLEDISIEPVHTSVLVTQKFSSGEVTEEKCLRRKTASAKKGDVEGERKLNKFGEPPPTSDLIARLFPSLKPKAKPALLQGLEQKSKTVNEKSLGNGIQSKLMKDKLLELETEINKFRAENSTLAKLRDDKEKAMMEFRKEIADFERKKAEELTQLEEYKKEELKRLQKERMVFEKYAVVARAIPDKKEREEIKVLKQQIIDLQEELKRKELRWSSTYTRLRNQIDALTKENQELRDEVKVMERLRLETWKKAEMATEKKTENSLPQLMQTDGVPLDARKKETDSLSKDRSGGRNPQASGNKSSYRIEQSSPRNIKVSHAVNLSAPGMTRNGAKESSLSLVNNVENTKMNTTAVPGMNLSMSYENVLNEEQVSSPASSCLEFNGAKDEIQEEIKYPDGKVEQVLRSGHHVIIFCNGTRKEVSADGKTIKVTFFNGDIKQIMSDQTVIYYYADAQTTHTTYPDGLEVLQFPNNQLEKHYPDGRKEITFPDQTIKYLFADGYEENVFPDGTIIRMQLDGTKIIEFNNGQREIHTPSYKRREYPDGTVKTVHLNGQQETKYSSGRVRIKDKEGNVIMDSKPH